MKKIFKSLMAVLSLALLVASCEQSPVKADYDYTFDESQRGYSFSASSQGASFKVGYEDSIYTVRVFRNYTEGEESLSLTYAGDVDVFELPEAVTFANGSTVAEFNLDIKDFQPGTTTEIAIAFDAPCMQYGTHDTILLEGTNKTIISFDVDYTWVSKGVVKMTSNWEGTQADVAIEQALEYSDAAGNHYMRLNSPYYYLAPSYCSTAGKHAYFYLDQDYNANNNLMPAGIQMIEDGYGWYWHPNYVGTYLQFANQANVYAISILWFEASSGSLYNPTTEMWVWNEDHYNAAKADPSWAY